MGKTSRTKMGSTTNGGLSVVVEGEFAADPAAKFHSNLESMVKDLAKAMERDVAGRETGTRSAAHTRPFVKGTATVGRAPRARVGVVPTGAEDPVKTRAIAAGRHNGETSTGRYIGTTPGAEGETGAFGKTDPMRIIQRLGLDIQLTKDF